MTLWPELVADALPLDVDQSRRLDNLRDGHFAAVGEFVKFPHLCPGMDCAVARYIREQPAARRVE